MIPNNFIYIYGLNLDRRILDKTLYEFDSRDTPPIITTVSFITLLVNWYNNGLLPLIRQFFLMPNLVT
jgi:hypothetical protein